MARKLEPTEIPVPQTMRVELYEALFSQSPGSNVNVYWSLRMGAPVTLSEGAQFDALMRQGKLPGVYRGPWPADSAGFDVGLPAGSVAVQDGGGEPNIAHQAAAPAGVSDGGGLGSMPLLLLAGAGVAAFLLLRR